MEGKVVGVDEWQEGRCLIWINLHLGMASNKIRRLQEDLTGIVNPILDVVVHARP